MLRPTYNSEPLEGRARHDALSPPIRKLERETTIYFLTEEAYFEFLDSAGYQDWIIQSPLVNGDGMEYVVRPYSMPEQGGMQIHTSNVVPGYNKLIRDVVATVNVDAWEILSQAPLRDDDSESEDPT
jgi:hypothetical protein